MIFTFPVHTTLESVITTKAKSSIHSIELSYLLNLLFI